MWCVVSSVPMLDVVLWMVDFNLWPLSVNHSKPRTHLLNKHVLHYVIHSLGNPSVFSGTWPSLQLGQFFPSFCIFFSRMGYSFSILLLKWTLTFLLNWPYFTQEMEDLLYVIGNSKLCPSSIPDTNSTHFFEYVVCVCMQSQFSILRNASTHIKFAWFFFSCGPIMQ